MTQPSVLQSLHKAPGAAHQVRLSLLLAWLLLSAAMLAALAVSWALPRQVLLDLTPRCVSQARLGRPCPACGLTRSFWLISHGRFRQAAELNQAGLPVYAAFAGNGVIALLYGRRCWRGKPPVNQWHRQ